MENNKLRRSRDCLMVSGENRSLVISSGKDKAIWMSIDDCFSYYSPFSPFSESKITMELPDHDQSQINSEEVIFCTVVFKHSA